MVTYRNSIQVVGRTVLWARDKSVHIQIFQFKVNISVHFLSPHALVVEPENSELGFLCEKSEWECFSIPFHIYIGLLRFLISQNVSYYICRYYVDIIIIIQLHYLLLLLSCSDLSPFEHNDENRRQFPDDDTLGGITLLFTARTMPTTFTNHFLLLTEIQ